MSTSLKKYFPSGTPIHWRVSKEGYNTKEGDLTLLDDKTLNITLTRDWLRNIGTNVGGQQYGWALLQRPDGTTHDEELIGPGDYDSTEYPDDVLVNVHFMTHANGGDVYINSIYFPKFLCRNVFTFAENDINNLELESPRGGDTNDEDIYLKLEDKWPIWRDVAGGGNLIIHGHPEPRTITETSPYGNYLYIKAFGVSSSLSPLDFTNVNKAVIKCKAPIIEIFNADDLIDASKMFGDDSNTTSSSVNISITTKEKSSLKNMEMMFSHCNKLEHFEIPDTSLVENMNSAFRSCNLLKENIDLDISHCTNLNNAFSGIGSSAITLRNGGVPVSMDHTFFGCENLQVINIVDIHPTTLRGAFYGCTSLSSIPQINTTDATDMSQMLYGCTNLTSIPQLNTSKVTDMRYMFGHCESLTSVPDMDTSNVTDMTEMFVDCYKLTSIPQLNTSKVTDMNHMFDYCKSLTSVPDMDTSNVTNMHFMFFACYNLIAAPQLDTSKVTDMHDMFGSCHNLKSVPQLDASSITSIESFAGISSIFSGCYELTDFGGFANLKVDLDMGSCEKLTHESAMNIINNLAKVSVSRTLKFARATYNTLSSAEIAKATYKGWTISVA